MMSIIETCLVVFGLGGVTNFGGWFSSSTINGCSGSRKSSSWYLKESIYSNYGSLWEFRTVSWF